MIELVNLKNVDHDMQMKIREWRNSPHVARYFQLPNISLETHLEWLKKIQGANPSVIGFLISLSENYIGFTYFHSIDYQNKKCDWGIYIYDQSKRGLGIGKNILQKSINFARENLKMQEMYLEVLADNYSAIKLYESFGFKICEHKNDKILRYKLDLKNS